MTLLTAFSTKSTWVGSSPWMKARSMLFCRLPSRVLYSSPCCLNSNLPSMSVGISMGNLKTWNTCWRWEGVQRKGRIICSWGIMWIVDDNPWNVSVCYLHTRWSIETTFSSSEAIISVQRSTRSTGSLINVFFHHSVGKRRVNLKVWKAFGDCFNCLPLAAVVGSRVFCVHGGLSPSLSHLS